MANSAGFKQFVAELIQFLVLQPLEGPEIDLVSPDHQLGDIICELDFFRSHYAISFAMSRVSTLTPGVIVAESVQL